MCFSPNCRYQALGLGCGERRPDLLGAVTAVRREAAAEIGVPKAAESIWLSVPHSLASWDLTARTLKSNCKFGKDGKDVCPADANKLKCSLNDTIQMQRAGLEYSSAYCQPTLCTPPQHSIHFRRKVTNLLIG